MSYPLHLNWHIFQLKFPRPSPKSFNKTKNQTRHCVDCGNSKVDSIAATMKIVFISTKFPSHHRALSASRFIVSAWSYPLITWMLGSRRLERGINGNYNFRRVFSLTNSGYIIQRPAQADDAQLIQVWFSSDCYLLLKNWIKLCLISKVHLKVFCCLSVPSAQNSQWCKLVQRVG